ncbi:YesL family protein [Virgibacillus kimchii]
MSMLNSRFYKILDEVTSVVILQFLWMVACLPIVTIIPATVALFSCIRGKMFKKSDSLIRKFFKELKKEIWRSNLVGIPLLIIYISLTQYFFIFPSISSDIAFLVAAAVISVTVIYTLFLLHLITVHVHMDISIKELFKNSFLLVFYQPLKSIGILVGIICLILLSLYLPILFFLCTTSLIGYISVYFILSKIHGEKLIQKADAAES